jgi:hypothetical protein
MIERNWTYGNLWIQGGPRARKFFADNPERAPALNKIPLVRWQKGFTYELDPHAAAARPEPRVRRMGG